MRALVLQAYASSLHGSLLKCHVIFSKLNDIEQLPHSIKRLQTIFKLTFVYDRNTFLKLRRPWRMLRGGICRNLSL